MFALMYFAVMIVQNSVSTLRIQVFINANYLIYSSISRTSRVKVIDLSKSNSLGQISPQIQAKKVCACIVWMD
jgi:hypothetical protein